MKVAFIGFHDGIKVEVWRELFDPDDELSLEWDHYIDLNDCFQKNR